MDVTEQLVGVLTPVLDAAGLELVDLIVAGSHLQVTVDRPGGVDLDVLGEASRKLSRQLDAVDPFARPYTMEVSSPGLERRLRTPAHFARATGETVTVRTHPGVAAVRRVHGVLSQTDEEGITLEGPDVPDGTMRIGYDQIERARTVFEWGSEHQRKSSQRAKGHERERSRS